jgi:hypothetical protein
MTTCQWIGAHGYQPTCCKPVAAKGVSYCAEHYAIVYAKGTALGKRKKDARVANTVRQMESDMNAAIEELINEGFDPYTDQLELVDDPSML